MMVTALIVEPLDADGTLKTLQLDAKGDFGRIVVAFADDYGEPRQGPFHFLDGRYDDLFNAEAAQCRARRLGRSSFYKENNLHHFVTEWRGIPTERGTLSYDALSLPEMACPKDISIHDPQKPERQYTRYS